MNFSLTQEQIPIFGIEVPQSVVIGVAASAFILLFCAFLRFKVKRFTEQPKGFQNAVEMIVEAARNYTRSQVHGAADVVAPYIITIGAYILCTSMVEFLGLHPPLADLSNTAAMGLMTFLWINYAAFRYKGFAGRFKGYLQPVPVVAPFKMLSDITAPVSMACRLYGNMLSGVLVMGLLYSVLFLSIGIPAVLSVYFTLFHAAIQAYIFVTLTLAFMAEALEGSPVMETEEHMAA